VLLFSWKQFSTFIIECRQALRLEQFSFEKVQRLGKDLSANHCREMLAGELRPP
jgi:hypothetical protein